MAALFVDLDGTAFRWNTEEFLPGAQEQLLDFHRAGHQIIFTTRRDGTMFPIRDVDRMLKRLFPGCGFMAGIESPRIIMNDEGVAAIKHPKNEPWNYDLVALARTL